MHVNKGGGEGAGKKRKRGRKGNAGAVPGGQGGKRAGDVGAAARADFLSGLMD